MPISWKNARKFTPDIILQRIAETRTINDKGNASFSGFELQEHVPVLYSMLEFPAACEPFDKTTLIWQGLSKATPDINKDTFIRAVNEVLTTSLSKKNESFVLVTSISAPPLTKTKNVKALSLTVSFHEKFLSRKFHTRKDLLEKNNKIEKTIDDPPSYIPISVKVTAKNEREAVNRALYEIDLLRGIWCLFVNSYMQVSFFSSVRAPINVIRLGNCHTLHKTNGNIATDTSWFEYNYSFAKPYKSKSSTDYSRHTRIVFQRLRKASYKEQLADSIVAFARAFDEPDPGAAYLRLWTSLESLVTPNQADYSALVRRCSFLFADHEYQQQILEHLREFRNSIVHTTQEQTDARTNCYHLQTVYRALIWFLINNGTNFLTLAEANEFLDLPSDHKSISRRIELLQKANKFITPKK
jgi:hypothetical protein